MDKKKNERQDDGKKVEKEEFKNQNTNEMKGEGKKGKGQKKK